MSVDHVFELAASIRTDSSRVSAALANGRHFVLEQMVTVHDAYCVNCRKPYTAAFETACQAPVDNRHLIGGRPDGSRAKRKHNHDCLQFGCNTAEVYAARQEGLIPG